MNKIYIILGTIIVVATATLAVYRSQQTPRGLPIPVACTTEAMICPDGSSVGRTGPNCQFSACPTVSVSTTTNPDLKTGNTTKLNQRILINGIYITPLTVVEDSRCATGVQCVWAGRVRLTVRLQSGSNLKDMTLINGTPVIFDGKNITLQSVIPEKTQSTTPLDYRFIFSVTNSVTTTFQNGTVTGQVTTSPTCPVERNPPDPACAPRPYPTTINVFIKGTTSVYKSTKTDSLGNYSIQLKPGMYEIQAVTTSIYPRCSPVFVDVKSGENLVSDISCDSGIR
ncbi:hypothetical protein H0W91_00140 [Patescibacteria group bacterium]|nr:hypothetical protein [Patescibacteria group bacterium]